MAYSGYEISDEDRAMLARFYPPKFSDFIGHHVTWEFGVDPETAKLPPNGKLSVIGYTCDDSLEALVVSIDGVTSRPDGGTLHITWSLDREAGRKPVHSNEVIKANGYEKTVAINISTAPRFFK